MHNDHEFSDVVRSINTNTLVCIALLAAIVANLPYILPRLIG